MAESEPFQRATEMAQSARSTLPDPHVRGLEIEDSLRRAQAEASIAQAEALLAIAMELSSIKIAVRR